LYDVSDSGKVQQLTLGREKLMAKAKHDLSKVPSSALWKELERRELKEYLRRVAREMRISRKRGEK
jgi:hypothetical protein